MEILSSDLDLYKPSKTPAGLYILIGVVMEISEYDCLLMENVGNLLHRYTYMHVVRIASDT